MFLQSYDGLLAVASIVLIEPPTKTPNGTPFQTIHYQIGAEARTTRAHPDYVNELILRSASERE